MYANQTTRLHPHRVANRIDHHGNFDHVGGWKLGRTKYASAVIRVLAVIGALHVIFMLSGVFGLNDYKVCIAGAGSCSIYINGEQVD
jgi:hypothetical protein